MAKTESRKRIDEQRTRQCAVTRDMLSIDHLIRFVETPDNTIIPDLKMKLPGRGVWIRCGRHHISSAVKSGAFARTLKKNIKVDPSLADQLDKLLLARVLERLSLATKAGLVTTGFVKISKTLKKGEVIALIHARDGAPEGKRKLDALFKKATNHAKSPEGLYIIPSEILSIKELSLAIGRENVVHAAIAQGGAGLGLLGDLEKLISYRENPNYQKSHKPERETEEV